MAEAPHIPDIAEDDEDVAFPTASLEVLWYLDPDGVSSFCYEIKGEANYNEAIGTLHRLAHDLVHEVEDRYGEEEG